MRRQRLKKTIPACAVQQKTVRIDVLAVGNVHTAPNIGNKRERIDVLAPAFTLLQAALCLGCGVPLAFAPPPMADDVSAMQLW